MKTGKKLATEYGTTNIKSNIICKVSIIHRYTILSDFFRLRCVRFKISIEPQVDDVILNNFFLGRFRLEDCSLSIAVLSAPGELIVRVLV